MENPFNCPSATHPVHWMRHFMCSLNIGGMKMSSAGMHCLQRALFWMIQEQGDPLCPGLH